MFKKVILSLLVIGIAMSSFSQTNINDYKYVIVPNQYNFLKEADQYQLNSLTKFLFNKYGFQAILEGESFPEDLASSRCLALNSNVIKEKALLKTKLRVELKDCNNNIVFTTRVGETRVKEFDKAYHLALRDAFESFESISYSYNPNKAMVAKKNISENAATNSQAEIAVLKKEIETLKKEKEVQAIEAPRSIEKTADSQEKQPANVKTVKPVTIIDASGTLFAQPLDNGFQLVDTTPKVIYKIKQTGLDNVFLVEGKNAILYKKGARWILEYYVHSSLKQEEMDIKF